MTAQLTPLADLLSQDPEWLTWALCPQSDPDAFFPEKGGSTLAAKRLCVDCPVRDECLEYALAHDLRYGVWGGLSERERRRYRSTGARPVSIERGMSESRMRERDERDARVAALTAEGLTQTQISRRLSMAKSTVSAAQRRIKSGEAA